MPDTRKTPNIFPTTSPILSAGAPYEKREFTFPSRMGEIPQIFAHARGYLETYRVSERFRELDKAGWEIIPYIITKQEDLNTLVTSPSDFIKKIQSFPHGILPRSLPIDTRIIHMARRRNPNPNKDKPANNWLLEWMGPLDSPDIRAQIFGIDSNYTGSGGVSAAKSLGAGTVLSLEGKDKVPYVVLATRYPNYPKGAQPNIQTPYSLGLDTPELRYLGEKYLDALISQGERDLFHLETKNLPALGSDLTLVKALIYVENMHEVHPSANRKERNIFFKGETKKVILTLGANGEYAYQRGSHAGAKGIIQITEGAYVGYKNASGGRNSGLRDEYIHEQVPLQFEEMVKSHRASVLVAYSHLDRQMREYRDHPDQSAYLWLRSEKGAPYAPYILAAGYNSNNTGRVGDLLMALRGDPSPGEVMERFYQNLTNQYPEETRGYMKKLEYVMRHVMQISVAELPID